MHPRSSPVVSRSVRPSGLTRAAWTLLVLALSNCAAQRPAPIDSEPTDGVERCRYELVVLEEQPLRLDVTAQCQGRGVLGLGAATPQTLQGLGPVTSTEGSIEHQRLNFQLPRPVRHANFHYRIDLDAVRNDRDSIDVAVRRGQSVVAPVSTFLLHPLPLDPGTAVELRVHTPPQVEFFSGLLGRARTHRIAAHEIPVSTYAAFGRFEHREVVLDSGRAQIDLVILGPDFQLSPDVLRNWLEVSARAVAEFFGSFPAERALVVLVSEPEDSRVRFGRLLPESGPGILVLIGSKADRSALHEDWILVHELLHIGVPSFHGEGQWFDEGIATYFEPIVRVRAGLLSEEALWREFLTQMPKGLPALTREGLARNTSWAGVYWGGALYCFLADVAARRSSCGRLGLEDGLRRLRALGGNASEVWDLPRTLAHADQAFQEPILVPLAERYREGAPLDLVRLFEELGVMTHGREVRLRDDAPLAAARRALIRGAAEPGPFPVGCP